MTCEVQIRSFDDHLLCMLPVHSLVLISRLRSVSCILSRLLLRQLTVYLLLVHFLHVINVFCEITIRDAYSFAFENQSVN